jgi:hypothetical protein
MQFDLNTLHYDSLPTFNRRELQEIQDRLGRENIGYDIRYDIRTLDILICLPSDIEFCPILE